MPIWCCVCAGVCWNDGRRFANNIVQRRTANMRYRCTEKMCGAGYDNLKSVHFRQITVINNVLFAYFNYD